MKHSAHSFIRALLLALTAIALASCTRNIAYATEESAGGAQPRVAMMSRKSAGIVPTGPALANSVQADAMEAELDGGAFQQNDNAVANGSGADTPQERKLIRNGNITLEVQNLSAAETAAERWAKEFGGYIASSSTSPKNAYFTVRIPSSNFDAAMETAGTFGTVKNRGVYTEDVSEQFYDTKTRLETRKVLRDKLNSYLRQATNMQDILKIERELNSVQSEIESMEGRLKRLNDQIDFSTISISFVLPYATTDQGFEFPEVSESIRRFFACLVAFYGGYIAVICYAVICGIGVIAALAFFYWLLLGKIGLLRILFEKIRK